MRFALPALLIVGVVVAAIGLTASFSFADHHEGEKQAGPALRFKVNDIHGKETDLSKYQGKVVLMVNVASKCGNTPQYAGLEKLHEEFGEQGLVVAGFPCNQFGGQEPGSEIQILEFCEATYGVKFDMFSKVDVNGENAHPLYKYLTGEQNPVADKGPIKWNFEKFLVDRQGNVIARFRDKVKPESEQVVSAIKKALAEGKAG